jgi:type II secretory pathway predicted ATPase ExeA
MYEEYYGLRTKPFSKTPDPEFLFLSRTHEEAMARLQYAVEEKEIVMLTGDVGCGKTTLTRALIDTMDGSQRAILVLNPRLTPVQLLRVVARRFGVEEPPNRKDALLEVLYERVYVDFNAGVLPVIIIDESQLVPGRDTFEEIRLLTNFQLDDTNMLSLIIVGQSDLNRRMKHKAYKPLMQRVGLFYHIGPLLEDEIRGYLRHRLSVAGRDGELFSDEAVKAIYRCSGGIPRVINNLATASLLEGVGADADIIDEGLVYSASAELGLSPSVNHGR